MVGESPEFIANRARLALALSQFSVPLLRGIYRDFEGDLVEALVLGEIAHRNVESWLANHDNPEAALHDPQLRLRVMRPCNALSIAEACEIPRETVRRKVNKLIERGWILRDDQGLLYLSQALDARFSGSHALLAEHLLATAERIRNLLGPAADAGFRRST